MNRNVIAETQPIVYQTLSNALKTGKVSHCYLFTGEKGTMKKETAFLLAQSLICDHKEDEWACEKCTYCERIIGGTYADLIYIDGSKDTIKIEAINQLQQQFSRTALEAPGQKIFIINDCENMTLKAANSLLKFIEEPYGHITGIFITSQPSRVLSTIVSRCQNINFRPVAKEAFHQYAAQLNLSPLDCHLLSQLVHNRQEIKELSDSEKYSIAVKYFVEFMNYYLNNRRAAVVYLQENGFKTTNKKDDKLAFILFLEIAMIFINDLHNHRTINDDSWDTLLEKARSSEFNSYRFLSAVCLSRDRCNTAANLLLLIDQFLYNVLEV